MPARVRVATRRAGIDARGRSLTLGRRGNRLAGEVRTWRNEGKRAIDLKADLLATAGGTS